MTPSELLLEGVELMLFGMGFVFVFLVLLVGVVSLMSRLIATFAPSAPTPAISSPASSVESASHGPDAETLAAIQSAIAQHRARRG
ncbi:oxaloacetate decarboxylase [Ectopseudomonas alcaliphila JAB1]|jgi:oxaloacetate decarboxylase gamma subunit|nr:MULTISPECIES: OadG family transporter subunit [Pseudomonas]APU29818.1 oxaloacetate decarboxylase [Pseudomonas alcaliphila JAB1]MAE23560.1 oxaloacetate decarboxylase [Pseudomonas sp.]TRO34427.1 oxaloacetate decarboxylase [Pseudomonas sp. ALS1279]|tara:strand:+ start:2202 stop:2459 length:258 start_codon:yes stop_codon:yes gene_type:complete